MTQLLTSFADRLLEKLAPKADVGACCPNDPFYYYRCPSGWHQTMTCHYNCACVPVCGPWVADGYPCR